MEPSASIPGTQAIARAAKLLRLVTSSGHDGASLQELSASAGLSRSTAHRLLSALRAEGLVDRDESSTRWMPGPELSSVLTASERTISRPRAVTS